MLRLDSWVVRQRLRHWIHCHGAELCGRRLVTRNSSLTALASAVTDEDHSGRHEVDGRENDEVNEVHMELWKEENIPSATQNTSYNNGSS